MKVDQLVWLSWFFGGGRGDAAEVSVFESVGVAADVDDVAVLDEPVDHGGGTMSSPKTSPQRPKGLCRSG